MKIIGITSARKASTDPVGVYAYFNAKKALAKLEFCDDQKSFGLERSCSKRWKGLSHEMVWTFIDFMDD